MSTIRRTVRPGWSGRFYEDFDVGDLYKHPWGRTVTQSDNVWFTLITMAINPIHFNSDYAEKTEFKKPLVNSAITLSVVTGMSVQDLSMNGVNLGWDEVRILKPVFEGDTLYSESEVLSKRESNSRPNMGIINVKTTGYNQHGVAVMTFRRAIMVYKREHSPWEDVHR